MGKRCFCLLFAFLVLCFHVHVLNSQNLTCNLDDLKALNGFLKAIDQERIDGWENLNCCNSNGVICNSSTSLGLPNSTIWDSRVVSLHLGNRKLKGSLSDSLANLTQLRYLNLSQNLLRGSIPYKLFQLKNLQVLDLSGNWFSGSIIVQFVLPSIMFLDLSNNFLDGSMDINICRKSTRIQVLNLSMNRLTGQIPAEFGSCSLLQHLSLNSNNLSGTIPDDLWKLKQLKQLNLQENGLYGPLVGARYLSNLVKLDVSWNMFSETIPDVFKSLQKLEELSARSNKFFGSIPNSLLQSPTIQLLDLRNNCLSGSIDLNWTGMVDLRSLKLGLNPLHGPLPDSLSHCRELRSLSLSSINLNCQVPDSFKNLSELSFLSLFNTSLRNLSASLDVLQKCSNLTVLGLTKNFRGEEMPTRNLQFKSLKALIIPNCGLTGPIPSWLSSSPKLQLLDLSWNHLVGTIPDWFSRLDYLFYLDLSNNSLSGDIPKSLTKLQSLIYRKISFDEPTTDFRLVTRRNQSANKLEYKDFWSLPPSLDLSHNHLTGIIWPEFRNLKNLHFLNLKSNYLHGTIPSELSDMKSLETLDLSNNNLSGIIPSSLTSLSFLSQFSIAYNNIVGRVPSGGQFFTFPCSSFEGNPGLQCPSCNFRPNSHDDPSSDDQDEDRISIIGLPFEIGVLSGFFVAVVICFMSGMAIPKVEKGKRITRPRRS